MKEDSAKKGSFAVTHDNPSFDLLNDPEHGVDRHLFAIKGQPYGANNNDDKDADKQLLLLAGPAGSGKSTFINELELHILEYDARCARLWQARRHAPPSCLGRLASDGK